MATNLGILFDHPIAQPLDVNGAIQPNVSYVFYLTGTTTATPVYSNGTLATSLGNVINAGAGGQFPVMYLNPAIQYRVQLWSANNGLGILLKDIDPYITIPSSPQYYGGVDTGAANAHVLTFSGYTANTNGNRVTWVAGASDTGGAGTTVNINAIGAIALKLLNGATLPVGNVVSGQVVEMVYYNGTYYQTNATVLTGGGGGGSSITIAAGSNISNLNLFQALGSPAGVQTVTLTVAAGARLLSTDPTAFALDTSGFTSGSTINLTNLGYIQGRGGDGGKGGEMGGAGGTTTDRTTGFAGRPGGAAIQGPGAGNILNITNANGFIFGGGGGGGGGGGTCPSVNTESNGGGGGGGAGGSKGGYGGGAAAQLTANGSLGVDGGWADTAANGAGGAGATTGGTANAGGAGGDWGAAGTVGAGSASDATHTAPGAAGAAGKAINLNAGTVNFVSGGTAPHVKGAVS